MKFFWISFLYIVLFACHKKTDDGSVVLARVNEQTLTVDQVESVLSPQQRSKEQIRIYINDWVTDAVLFQEAQKLGIHKDKTLVHKSNDYFTKLVVATYLETETGPAVKTTKESIRHYYQKNRDGFVLANDNAVLRHFITDNISDARTIRKNLIRKNSNLQSKFDYLRFYLIFCWFF